MSEGGFGFAVLQPLLDPVQAHPHPRGHPVNMQTGLHIDATCAEASGTEARKLTRHCKSFERHPQTVLNTQSMSSLHQCDTSITLCVMVLWQQKVCYISLCYISLMNMIVTTIIIFNVNGNNTTMTMNGQF